MSVVTLSSYLERQIERLSGQIDDADDALDRLELVQLRIDARDRLVRALSSPCVHEETESRVAASCGSLLTLSAHR